MADIGTKVVGGTDDLSGLLLQAHGYSVNPQLQILYKGVDMRQFQLTFNFTPKSRSESETVRQIIHTFKYYASPSLTSGGGANNQAMFLVPPAIFNVQFMHNGTENLHLPKYADCVLANIDVNHAPNGFAAHTDGSPIQTQLTLQFHEIEIVEKGRLSLGFTGSDDKGLR